MFLRNIQRSDGDRCVERYRSRCGEETDRKGLSHGFELPEYHTISKQSEQFYGEKVKV
jgi:hypothetical protein